MPSNGRSTRSLTPLRRAAPGKIVAAKLKGRDKVEFCRHVLERMRQRGISEDEVIQAIRKPTRRVTSTQPGRQRVRKNRNKRESVDVVYKILADRILIITAIVIRKAGRAAKRKKSR